MDKQETIEHLCKLVSHVGETVFRNELEHDCFCGKLESELLKNGVLGPFNHLHRVHPEVLAFIDNAVFQVIKARKE